MHYSTIPCPFPQTGNLTITIHRLSEQSKSKAIGITIETRPDYCLRPHLSQMLRYGCTRLEIGVQSVYEDVARDTNRGHTVRAVSESFHLAKDAGLKVVAHMMPDLPNVGVERDLEQFKEYFENPAFRSDGLKLYPTLVIRGTGLYELWRTGRYKNYTPNVLVDVVARILSLVPPWTRVYRVQRYVFWTLVDQGTDTDGYQRYPTPTRHKRLRKFWESTRTCSEQDERFWCCMSRCAVPRSWCEYLAPLTHLKNG